MDIKHSGVKGMKWGVRKDRDKSSGSRNVSRQKTSKTKGKIRRLSDLSDAELKQKIDRLNMEKQYKQYMKDLKPSQVSYGKELLKKSIDTGTKVVVSAAFLKIAKKMFG